ncbi:MAG TPA: hypothetical protein VFP89_15510 [Propionibacteriaceae bacterium]|nr:hypothetical protein [Propionibacteriaceae bacterium]
MDGIGKPDAVAALAPRGQQLLLAAHRSGEVPLHFGVLGSPDALVAPGLGADVLSLVELVGEQSATASGAIEALISCSGFASRLTVTCWDPSTTTLPPSQSISSRSVPTKSCVQVVSVPVAPSPKSTIAFHLILDGDVTLESVRALREHTFRHATDPLPQVEPVRHLVHQDLAAPSGPPFGLVVVALRPPPGGDDPGGVAQGAECARSQERLQITVERVGALVEEDAEGELRLAGRDVDELAGLLGADPDGLLDHCVHPVLEGVDAHLRVQVVRHRGHDRIDVTGDHHVGVVGENGTP